MGAYSETGGNQISRLFLREAIEKRDGEMIKDHDLMIEDNYESILRSIFYLAFKNPNNAFLAP